MESYYKKEESFHYIQNRKNWCWAVACKLVGEQYKKRNMKYTYSICTAYPEKPGEVFEYEYEEGVPAQELEGLRKEIVAYKNDIFFVDAWQRAIVMNANTSRYIGYEGDVSGDDVAKVRGLKYVVTGDVDSTEIEIRNLGYYQSVESLTCQYGSLMERVMEKKNYLIGNAVLNPGRLCHSFVILDIGECCTQIYDPWDGRIYHISTKKAFEEGFSSALGTGIVKWVQFIEERNKENV